MKGGTVWRVILSLISLELASVSAAALAQERPPALADLTQAYRTYRAAIDRDDWAGALEPAREALAAGEAGGVPSPTIAVLALNLAITQLNNGLNEEAEAPARRAVELMPSSSEMNLLQARLALGEVLAKVDKYDEAKSLLVPVLEQADARGSELDVRAFPAATALGAAAIAHDEPKIALVAYESAFAHAAGGRFQLDANRANAIIGRGLALLLQHQDRLAREAFITAQNYMSHFVQEHDDDVVTAAESVYATAMAYEKATEARLRSEGSMALEDVLDVRSGFTGSEFPDGAPRCSMSVQIEPQPNYPRTARLGVGAVVVRLALDDQGNVLSHRVLASVPSKEFGEAVDAPGLRWTAVRKPDSPPGCRMATRNSLVPIVFLLGP